MLIAQMLQLDHEIDLLKSQLEIAAHKLEAAKDDDTRFVLGAIAYGLTVQIQIRLNTLKCDPDTILDE
jgi:hypothetical protein